MIYLGLLLQKSNINLVKTFLIAFIRFAKNKLAILITMGFNPLRLFVFAHNGLKPHCYKKWIVSLSARNDKFKIYNDDKNDFANLNLVKSFLTLIKFTFDSLSRKIKNPCLVINKLFIGGIQ